jgi:hypothetical protein
MLFPRGGGRDHCFEPLLTRRAVILSPPPGGDVRSQRIAAVNSKRCGGEIKTPRRWDGLKEVGREGEGLTVA